MAKNNAAVVEIAQTASRYSSSIVLQAENKYIDVKSILGLFTTLVSSQQYELHVIGPDAEDAKAAMVQVFEKHDLNIVIAPE